MGDPEFGRLGLRGLDEVKDRINQRIVRRDVIKEYTLKKNLRGEVKNIQWVFKSELKFEQGKKIKILCRALEVLFSLTN